MTKRPAQKHRFFIGGPDIYFSAMLNQLYYLLAQEVITRLSGAYTSVE